MDSARLGPRCLFGVLVRDLILLGALLGVVPLILRAPQIGILTWIWITLMNPQQEVYGFLHGFTLNLYIAVLTAFAWIASKERKVMPLNPVALALVMFAVWMSLTTYNALTPIGSYDLWDRTIKTFILGFAILTISTNKARIQAVVWMMVLSLGYYGVKGGGFTLLTGGRNHVFGPDNSMISDNNNLGLALVMILPFINYLRITAERFWVRMGLLAMLGLTLLGVIGTYSRGALFALGVSGVAYAVKSRSGIIPLILGGLLIVTLPSVVPSNWFARMSTIQSASQDQSFQERLAAWTTSLNVAKDRPTGGGFNAIQQTWVAERYASPGSLKIGRAAHSIYFEVLGDHGFFGLGLYLLILVAAWYNTSATIAAARDRPEMEWAVKLARTMQVSMIGYLVGGALLSMAYYDGFIILLALTGALLLFVKKPLSADASARPLPIWRRPVEQGMPALPGAADLRLR